MTVQREGFPIAPVVRRQNLDSRLFGLLFNRILGFHRNKIIPLTPAALSLKSCNISTGIMTQTRGKETGETPGRGKSPTGNPRAPD